MSRGRGATQLGILRALTESSPEPWSVEQLAACVYGTRAPTAPMLIATRRSVRRLAKDGAVQVERSVKDPGAGPEPGARPILVTIAPESPAD